MRSKFFCLLISSILVGLAAPNTFAQLTHLFPTTIGERAFGFAGAFTALADDATAGWYNPAGYGFLEHTYINATGNVYMYESLIVKDYLVIQTNDETASTDLNEEQVTAIPTTFAVAKSLSPIWGGRNHSSVTKIEHLSVQLATSQ